MTVEPVGQGRDVSCPAVERHLDPSELPASSMGAFARDRLPVIGEEDAQGIEPSTSAV